MLYYKFRNILIGLGLLIIFATPLTVVGQADSSGVLSADISGEVTESGQLLVTERIQYDLGPQKQTGFVRRLQAPSDGSITIDSVARDGLEEAYRTTRAGKSLRVITGDPDIAISGEHTYTIRYSVDGAVQSGSSGQQVVWPVIRAGNVTAENITITLSAPERVSSAVCSFGTQSGCPVDRTDSGIRAAIDELPSNQSVVVRADLPAGAVDAAPAQQQNESNQGWIIIILASLAFLALVSFGAYYVAFKVGSQEQTESVPEHIDSLS